MKTLTKTIMVAFAAFVISSCGNDDPKIDSKLVGKWKYNGIDVQITVPGNNLYNYLIATIGMDSTEAEQSATALEAGESFDPDIATTEFKDNGSYESTSTSNTVVSGKWSITADEKMFTTDVGTDHEQTYPILSLTDTDFILKYDLTEDLGLPQVKYIILVKFQRM